MTENTLQTAADSVTSFAVTAVRELRQTFQRLKTRTFQTKSLDSMLLSADVQSRTPLKKVLSTGRRTPSDYACAVLGTQRKKLESLIPAAGAWTSLINAPMPGTHHWKWHFCLDGCCSPHSCRVSHRVLHIPENFFEDHCRLPASIFCCPCLCKARIQVQQLLLIVPSHHLENQASVRPHELYA